MFENLNEYVGWVASMEAKAAQIYRKLALTATEDEDLVKFARKLSEEEEWHYRSIRSVDKEIINIVGKKRGNHGIDDKVINHVEGALHHLESIINSGPMSTDELLESILNLELSELNSIFLDVIDLFSEYKVELQGLKSHVRRHKKGIEAFAMKKGVVKEGKSGRGGELDCSDNNILVVEDESAIRDVLVLALKKYGHVEIAENGMEALNKVKKKHYDLIFSDIDMPEMSGIEFCSDFNREDPYLNRRIVFFSGAIGDGDREFIDKNHIKCLEKPSSLTEIRETALIILEREPEK